jgi:hypothetical protein
MIDIVIPTFKRLNSQITLSNIPKDFLDNVTLAVQPQEELQAKKIHHKIFVVSGDNIGFANTIKDITYEFGVNRKCNFWIMDDDLSFLQNVPIGDKLKKESLTEKSFFDMITETNKWLSEGLVHGAIGTTWNNPLGKYPYIENSRIMTNKFYNGVKLSQVWNEIDWTGCCGAEDFYVNLQLLTKGMSNKVWYKYVVAPSDTNTEGGCSEYRDIEYHNKSMRDLHSKFPQYVILKEKKQKSGPWKDMTKLSATISWKKAYQSSQITTLEEFFS